MSNQMAEFYKLYVLLSVVQVHGLVNLALRKPTWQQYPWLNFDQDYGGENAVDGLYTDRGATGGQCTISDEGKYTAEWRVDLGRVVSISKINIFYRTENRDPGPFTNRMSGFFLYISNTTSKEDGHLCFHDIKTVPGTLSEDQRINCSVPGRYVIYYNERRPNVTYPSYYSQYAYNELCEVEVYGCDGSFGNNCTHLCPTNCRGTLCDANTGQCFGCVPGYEGQLCTQVCNNNTYGPQCALNCGNCSNGETCHHINGTCPQGCAEGALGDTCQEGCQSGYYGRNCSKRCGQNCNVTNQCDRVTGQCEGGCKPGWTGNTCNQRCQSGYYGLSCSKRCGQNCNVTNQCDRITGQCEGGCKPGWTGSRCYQIKSTSTLPSLCRDNYKNILIVIVVISVLTVVTGCLINFVIWKRNATKFSRMRQRNKSLSQNKTGTIKDDKDQQYTELEEIDNSKTYEEIHSYTNLNHQ